ncbi:hypothetical protein KFL_000110190 [Klebsormidium nitens]|uniref:Uncharacterized protein n=1 Tax=Klebsormidium nitens TaxID=105231 RepID=A0A1Y1HL09_KLENI|nr:hypothetical protein KFL_000110190 [Klebsormidium nitens]|eukprot:GAQ78322.1 hypothetical protein KFL_000110190 [Klebsormidium nitens]
MSGGFDSVEERTSDARRVSGSGFKTGPKWKLWQPAVGIVDAFEGDPSVETSTGLKGGGEEPAEKKMGRGEVEKGERTEELEMGEHGGKKNWKRENNWKGDWKGEGDRIKTHQRQNG